MTKIKKVVYQGKGNRFPKDIPEDVRMSILNNFGFFDKLSDALEESESELPKAEPIPDALAGINKQAYPNFSDAFPIEKPADMNKWMQTAKEIYYYKNNNIADGINRATSGWDSMEKNKFLNWLKFYEGNNHNKYKKAQVSLYESGLPGYYLPYKKEESETDHMPASDEMSPKEKRSIIEAQRKKIITRLDSAEKLLRAENGQIFAGDELETLIEIIHKLKQKIYGINKRSSSTRTYDDMIVREANVLVKNGYSTAAAVLFKLADQEPAPAAGQEPAAPSTGAGVPGTEPMKGQELGAGLSNENPSVDSLSKGMSEFLETLDGANVSFEEELKVDDESDGDDELIVEAQLAQPLPEAPKEIAAPKQVPAPPNAPIEVKDNGPTPLDKNFDAIIDSAFQNIKISDVIAKLEDLTSIYKNREMPRQLAIVDLMLDRLGLSPLFPTLSEATNRSLDSSNYILSRLEDILSRLRGLVGSTGIEFRPSEPKTPEAQAAKAKLEEEKSKEDARKRMRKEVENQALEEAVKPSAPDVEIQEDLNKPLPTIAPAPAAPKV